MSLIEINKKVQFYKKLFGKEDEEHKFQTDIGNYFSKIKNFINSKQYEQNLLLFQSLEQSAYYINTHYVSQNSKPIQLYIIPSINIISNKGKTIDAGGTLKQSIL